MPGCIVSATTASFRSVEKRRLRATPVITSTLENVSDIGTCLGLSLGPPASAGVRSKRGALQEALKRRLPAFWRQTQLPPAVRPHASLRASAHCYLLVISPDRLGAAP